MSVASSKYPRIGAFLTRAKSDVRRQEIDSLIKELARNPKLRDLGWAISHKPLNKIGVTTIGIGDWYSSTTSIVDKSVLIKTDKALRSLGWQSCISPSKRTWCYTKILSEVSVTINLTWSLGSSLSTDDLSIGKRQFPIKYAEIYIEDGYAN
jgi:hypothetical protein